MTTHLVTFSDESMSRAANALCWSARQNGTQTEAIFRPLDMVYDPRRDELTALMERGPRGCGFWSWKPAIIYRQLTEAHWIKDGDTLIYSDAGVEFINNVSHIIERMDQDIFLFGNNWEHAHWCKGDVAYTCWPDNYGGEAGSVANVWGRYGKQVQASVIFFRVSDYARQFVAEWLKWCLFEGGRLIDDSPSHYNNHPEFREHRHDQAILTTMAYREGIKLHYWPAVYNKGGTPEFIYEQLREYAGDDYPILFSHHRRRNHEWEQVA